MYLPSVGFFMMIAALPFYLLNHKYFASVIVSFFVIITILAGLTVNRNKVWKTDLTLFADCVRKSPDKPRPLNNLGDALVKAGRSAEAIPYFDKAIKLNPDFFHHYFMRGYAFFNLQNYNAALKDFNKAAILDSTFAETYMDRACTYAVMQDFDKAILDFDKAIALDPENMLKYANRGHAKFNMGDNEGACNDWRKAAELGDSKAVELVSQNCGTSID
jgi:tetratricopeptide (TPR) repeat protein